MCVYLQRIKFYYYEQHIKREVQGIHICGWRWNERLKPNFFLTDGSIHLTYNGLCGQLEQINTKDRNEVNRWEFWVCDDPLWTWSVRRTWKTHKKGVPQRKTDPLCLYFISFRGRVFYDWIKKGENQGKKSQLLWWYTVKTVNLTKWKHIMWHLGRSLRN